MAALWAENVAWLAAASTAAMPDRPVVATNSVPGLPPLIDQIDTRSHMR